MKKVIFTLLLLMTTVISFAADEFAGLNKVNVWTGSHEVNWSKSLDLNASKFATAQVGDKVAFTIESVGADAEIFIQDASWTDVKDMIIKPIAATATQVSFTITDAALEALSAAVHIKGQNVTITSIDLYQQAEVKDYQSCVIYTGPDVAFGSWKKEVKIAADKFVDAEPGDKIKFNFTDVVSGAQIQINDGSYTESFVEYDDILEDSYEFVLTEENLAIIKENGIAIKGQKATVTTIELLTVATGGETTDTYNEVDVKSTAPLTFKGADNWQKWITIPGSSFADALVGDKVKFYIAVEGVNPQLQIADKSWASIFSKPQVDVSGDSYTFKIEDEAMLAVLKEGLFIKGQNVTVQKITLLTNAAIKNFDSSVIYDGPVVDLNGWKNIAEVAAAGFATAKLGDKIVINFTDVLAGAQVQLNTMVVGWNAFVEYDDIVGTSYEYVLNDQEVLDELKEFGLAIKGQKASISTVQLLSLQPTTGIDQVVNSFNENLPVEIFDLSGKRVSNMNAHGIYLLKKGNKVVKVAK